MKNRLKALLPDQSGVAIITALGIFVIIGMVGLAVDLGHLVFVKAELQRAAEAGATAGARALYPNTLTAGVKYYPLCDQALGVGADVTLRNKADGGDLTIGDIQTGSWTWNTNQFAPGCVASGADITNAVTVTTQKDNISVFFIQVLGARASTLSARATATVDWVGGLLPGAPTIPVAIGKKWAGTGSTVKVYFNAENQDTGGWFSTTVPVNVVNPSAAYLSDVINNGLPNEVKIHDYINVNTGVMESAHKDLNKYVNEVVWLPVIDTETMNGTFEVLGFCGLKVQEIGQDPGPSQDPGGGKKYMVGLAVPTSMAPNTFTNPGGDNFGLLTSPRLVQ
jgi:hypothetical protein